MNDFIKRAVTDLRGGRDTWRVLLLVTLPSFLIALGVALARQR
jgi:hypothetical protein